jgi:hypothetical protein
MRVHLKKLIAGVGDDCRPLIEAALGYVNGEIAVIDAGLEALRSPARLKASVGGDRLSIWT